MVVPVIAGAAILSFVAFGKDLLGEKTFNKTFKGLILVSIAGVGYLGYKLYKGYIESKSYVEEKATGAIDFILKTSEDITEDTEYLFKHGDEIAIDLVGTGVKDVPSKLPEQTIMTIWGKPGITVVNKAKELGTKWGTDLGAWINERRDN